MMRSAEYTAFARALEDAMCEKYDGELAMCTESAACSAIHYKSMSRIVGFNVRRNAKKTARIIRALILAAALALAGGAAMNLCEEDKGYFVFTQNGGNVEVNVADDDSYGEYLNGDIYCLRKLPKGYYMNGWIDSPTVSKFEYINSSGEKICFRQSAPKGSTHIYTCEDGKPFEFGQFGGYDVICSKVSDGRTYLWFDGKYMMWLAVPDSVSETEVSRIIDGVGWRTR